MGRIFVYVLYSCEIDSGEATLLTELIVGSPHILFLRQRAINLLIENVIFLFSDFIGADFAVYAIGLVNLRKATIGLLVLISGGYSWHTGSHWMNRADFRLENWLVPPDTFKVAQQSLPQGWWIGLALDDVSRGILASVVLLRVHAATLILINWSSVIMGF